MALFNSVDMCMACAKAFEGYKNCPDCSEPLTRVDARVFQALVVLRKKGYRPVRAIKQGFSDNKVLAVYFKGYSPGCGFHSEMDVSIEDGLMKCETKPWGGRDRFAALMEWTREAEELRSRVPYNRELCGKCAKQHDSAWYHGICKCPNGGNILSTDKSFDEGLPEKCLYLVEQTVSRDAVREKFFEEIL